MSRESEIGLAQAEQRHCHDQVALLRANLYRWGLRPTSRLRELERDLQRAEERLRELGARDVVAVPGSSSEDAAVQFPAVVLEPRDDAL
jgi:hypothetical protein